MSRGEAVYEGASYLFPRIRLFYILYRKTSLKKAAPY